jgi:plastocyanin
MQWSRRPARRAGAPLVLSALALVMALAGCGATSAANTAPPTATTALPTATTAPTTPTATIDPSKPRVEMVENGTGYRSAFAFVPATLTVKVGTTVVWLNTTQAPHTSTSDATPPLWDSDTVAPGGGTFMFTFTRAGTYDYHCNVHPTMHGTIVVTA